MSAFGDRIHQVALGVLVFGVTGSPLATALVFLVAAVPNLLVAAVAGTLVDRWDQRLTMVAADFLRAGLVVALPLAAAQNVWYAFPIVFVITCISVFFRAAKNAAVPRIVARDDLMAANSALWTSETLADLAGYPIAGLFVAILGSALTIAFWADAASYLVSGVVILGLVIPPVVHAVVPRVAGRIGPFARDFREGVGFLRRQPTLWQNTLVTALAQMSTGALVALALVYAARALDTSTIAYPTNYTTLETAIGLGNLIGGLAVGLIGTRFAKGWLVALGLLISGGGRGGDRPDLQRVAGGGRLRRDRRGQPPLHRAHPDALRRTDAPRADGPRGLVPFRARLRLDDRWAWALSGLLAQVLPVGLVLTGFGALTVACGVVALALPAMRDA